MNEGGEIRRSSRARKAPSKYVPGEGGPKGYLSSRENSDLELSDLSKDAEKDPCSSAETDQCNSCSKPVQHDEGPDGAHVAESMEGRDIPRPASKKRGRQRSVGGSNREQGGAAKRSGPNEEIADGQHGQADSIPEVPGFQELPQAACCALTGAHAPANFPASNHVR